MWSLRNKVNFFVVLLFIVQKTYSIPLFSEIMTIWNDVEKLVNVGQDPNQEIVNGLAKIQKQLNKNDIQIQEIKSKIESFENFIQRNTQFNEFYQIMLKIKTRTEIMDDLVRYKDYDETTLANFANQAVGSCYESIEYLLKMLSNLLIGPKGIKVAKTSSVLDMFSDWLKEDPERVCKFNQTAQQFLYLFYDDVLTVQLQGYTMAQFAWMIKQSQTKRSYRRENQTLHDDFKERAIRTRDYFIEAIKNSNKTIWKCDPKNHVKGKTYDEVTRFLQGFVTSEEVTKGSCKGDCEDTKNVQVDAKRCSSERCPRSEVCNGKLSNCISGASFFSICYSPSNSTRRYDVVQSYDRGAIKTHDSAIFGNLSLSCDMTDKTRRKQIEKYSASGYPCGLCMCICDEENSDKSDRFFNLRPSISNINKNMVVTGLRFVKSKRVFHLQIQEGKLIEKGSIDPSTVHWVDLDDYEITNPNIKAGVDYHKLTYNSRDLVLDEVNYANSPDFVVTGVRFQFIQNFLSLKVGFSLIDLRTNQITGTQYWNHYGLSKKSRTEIVLNTSDIPTKADESKPVWGRKQYVTFTHTDLKKDAAQTAIPFIDLQEVTANPPVPLTSVGLYYKGQKGYGGFVAPRISTYNYAELIALDEF